MGNPLDRFETPRIFRGRKRGMKRRQKNKSRENNQKPAYNELTAVNNFLKKAPPIKTVGTDFYLYQNGYWKQESKDTLRPLAQSILPLELRTARRESEILKHVEGAKQVHPDSLIGFYTWDEDGKSVLINVNNGVLRVSPDGTVVLINHDHGQNLTAKMPVKYIERAECPQFINFLEEIIPDNKDRELLQLLSGNLLLPSSRFETCIVSFGKAGSGKSTLAETIGAVFGNDLVRNLSLTQICDPQSYYLPNLKWAALNLGTELDSLPLGESSNFKMIVSGEPVEARPIYGSPFRMRTNCKLWFLSNNLPRFKNGTDAELRRVRFLKFDEVPAEVDRKLINKLTVEVSGILNWMLNGLVQLLNISEMPYGGENVREVQDRFSVSNDPLGTFLKQRCKISPECCVTKDELARAYNFFLEDYGIPAVASNWFFRRLYDRFPEIVSYRQRQGSAQTMMVRGLYLNE